MFFNSSLNLILPQQYPLDKPAKYKYKKHCYTKFIGKIIMHEKAMLFIYGYG